MFTMNGTAGGKGWPPDGREWARMLYGFQKVLYTFHVPLHHNDGYPMQPERLMWFQSEVLRIGGGLFRFPSGAGVWIDEAARVYRDVMMPVWVAASAAPEVEAKVINLAVAMRGVFEQKQVFVSAWAVDLVEPPLGHMPLAVLGGGR